MVERENVDEEDMEWRRGGNCTVGRGGVKGNGVEEREI
jgi:hypothetical protein